MTLLVRAKDVDLSTAAVYSFDAHNQQRGQMLMDSDGQMEISKCVGLGK